MAPVVPRRVLGVAGLLACGKDTACRYFRRQYGANEINADAVGHRVLGELSAALVTAFGSGILTGDGVDRKALGRLVFADPVRLAQLEAIVHPALCARVRELVAATGHDVVINAALLHRLGLAALCDTVLYVDCPDDICVVRAVRRDGLTPEDAARRLSRQEDVKKFRESADVVIGNAATLEDFVHALDGFAQTYFGGQHDGIRSGACGTAGGTQEGTLYPQS